MFYFTWSHRHTTENAISMNLLNTEKLMKNLINTHNFEPTYLSEKTISQQKDTTVCSFKSNF